MHPRRLLRSILAVVAATAFTGAAASAAGDVPTVPKGLRIEKIATVGKARELAVAPNGDLFVGTYGDTVYLVPDAQGKPGAPQAFVTLPDQPAAGVLLHGETLYIGAQFGVYRLPYHPGERRASAKPEKIASLRTSGESRDHVTTTLAFSKGKLYASVGSSCNACDPELDATRATIQEMDLDGKNMHARAVDIRNAIALAVDPANGDLWAGVAGRDELEHGHPYEIFDDVSSHGGTPDYGWLKCYDDRKPIGGASCANVVVPKAVFPAYETPIGAAFYPQDAKGTYAFPEAYRGGAFVALHGSWHTPLVPPRLVFVPFKHGVPARTVNWNDPVAQWNAIIDDCQQNGQRSCRPTGVAVGTDGSLFVSEDGGGAIWRIRPAGR